MEDSAQKNRRFGHFTFINSRTDNHSNEARIVESAKEAQGSSAKSIESKNP
jgi:hypothetical protein